MLIDDTFEKKTLACFLKSTEFAGGAAGHLKPEYFSGKVRHNLAKILLEYHRQYGAGMTVYAFTKTLAPLITKGAIPATDLASYSTLFKELQKTDISDYRFILSELLNFIRNKEWKALIEQAVKTYIPANNFEAIEKAAAKVAAISMTNDHQPYFFWNDKEIDARTERRRVEAKGGMMGIPTGIKAMDKILHKGGWFRKELYLLMAPPKRGKSMALYWFANVATWHGFNVAFFSCENGIQIIEDRIDGMNTDIEIKHLLKHIDPVYTKLKSKRPPGKLIIFEYPAGTLKCSEVDRQLLRLESEHGIKTNFLITDYLDIMAPEQKRDDRLVEEAEIGRGLRGLAHKFDIPALTPTQVNRSGSDKLLITGKDVKGTWEKIMDADTVISFSASVKEMQEDKMRIHFSESRNNESKTLLIGTKYQTGKFYREFLKEEVAGEAA